MKYIFPVKDVLLRETDEVSAIENPLASGDMWQASGAEFSLQVPEVGSFFVRSGREVEFSVVPGADAEWVQLYLNGQVLVALLHQRKIINFHASSFVHAGRGVMILGETGAGKTSLTLAFAMKGSGFLSDDLTPVFFPGTVPNIWSFNRKIKLRADSITQLNISDERLTEAEAGTGKRYLHLGKGTKEYSRLDTILKVETGDVSEPIFQELLPAEKFAVLRSEICSWEILAGMPETEKEYLEQLVRIVEQVEIVRAMRPAEIRIADFHDAVREYLDKVKG